MLYNVIKFKKCHNQTYFYFKILDLVDNYITTTMNSLHIYINNYKENL